MSEEAFADSPVVGGVISARLRKEARTLLIVADIVGQSVGARRLMADDSGPLELHHELVWIPLGDFDDGGTAHAWKFVVPTLRAKAVFQTAATEVRKPCLA